MPQVSRYPLDKTIEREIFLKFWHSVSALRDSDTVASFFSDFLTHTEEIMLAKRFAIAVLLLRGKRPRDIKRILHVSDTATSTVGAWLKNVKPKTLSTLERVIHESNWEELVDKIEAIMDSLPPRYGTNWSRVGKERWQRKVERASRQSFR
jgi:uncharacterized protein YerC